MARYLLGQVLGITETDVTQARILLLMLQRDGNVQEPMRRSLPER